MAEAEDMEKDEEDLILDVCKAFGKLNNWQAYQVPKTGISWHTAMATICWDSSTLETGTLVHIFDNQVKQDSALVTAIDHYLLSSLKKKYLLLSEVVFGSDCGQSYLASNILLSLTRMEQETGISVKVYCFTEPHARKSMCDRITAVLKTHARAYLNQGNNVETPAEVYKALTHNDGVRDCGVALVSYPPAKKIADQSQKIKNISLLRNFTLEQDRVISYKAYGMGSGQVTKLSEVKVPKIILLKIAHDFNNIGVSRLEQAPPATRRTAQMTSSQEDNEEESLYHNCSECEKSFRCHRDLLAHETTFLSTTRKGTRLRSSLCKKIVTALEELGLEKPTTRDMLDKQSWALQKMAPHPRHGKDVYSFLLDANKKGIEKADPIKVAAAMSADSHFERSQLLNPRKIKAYYSAMKSQEQ
uniref:C2H2-type domain-containing protein n=1 Tax=Plectus sambesii TaxID=2011161 RepID=A0A914XDX8_9BILA